MSQLDTFVIVDGNSLMHRAFHALPPLSNEDGVFTNAVFGFLSMLFKVIGDEQPRYLAVAFDLHGPTFRHTDYSEYKAGRKPTAPELKPQFDLVRECLTKMGVKILTCPTFEADDILGTFARRCEEAGIPALLVTGDRDLSEWDAFVEEAMSMGDIEAVKAAYEAGRQVIASDTRNWMEF